MGGAILFRPSCLLVPKLQFGNEEKMDTGDASGIYCATQQTCHPEPP